ncbi:MAG TPA: AIR synthase related protein, partial [Nitrospira sp.]
MTDDHELQLQCPVPVKSATVQLAHGGGGRLMQDLIREVFLRSFDNVLLRRLHDGATFPVEKGTLAFTTDSYVVSPLLFPGGNIGSLAVHGTINDLAMCGAMPLHLSAGFILEEGLSMETLRDVVESMAKAAEMAEVQIVTGDTKVVDRGKGDGMFINTAGIGVVPPGIHIGPQEV